MKNILLIKEQQLVKKHSSFVKIFLYYCMSFVTSVQSVGCSTSLSEKNTHSRRCPKPGFTSLKRTFLYINKSYLSQYGCTISIHIHREQMTSFSSHFRIYDKNDMPMINHCRINWWKSKREFLGHTTQKLFTCRFLLSQIVSGMYS